jgi:hypothetical protein
MWHKTQFFIVFILAMPVAAYAGEQHQHDHAAMSMAGHAAQTPLTEAGNDAFATIQEVIEKLMADPQTDWQRVNLEVLRQHLIDMNNFTLHVKVLAQEPIPGGVEFTVKPETPAAAGSLDRLFAAHPAILKQETGWEMQTKKLKNGYTASVTSKNPADVEKIRGLGYIGVVALGRHHQLHHWLMATGVNPHHH